jgi:hypothetical protein
MELLKSTANLCGIDFIDHRDILYYNKYKYRAQLNIYGLRRASFCSTIEKLIDRLEYRTTSNDRISIYYTELPKNEIELIYANIDKLSKYMDWLNARKKDKIATIRVEQNNASIFSNDLSLLHTLYDIFDGDTEKVIISEAKCTEFVGIKTFVNEPKHKFRVHMRNKVVNSDFRIGVSKIFTNNNKSLFPSPAFNTWLDNDLLHTWRHRYMASSYFVDYDDESMLSYLALMYGEFLGKRYKLEKRPI